MAKAAALSGAGGEAGAAGVKGVAGGVAGGGEAMGGLAGGTAETAGTAGAGVAFGGIAPRGRDVAANVFGCSTCVTGSGGIAFGSRSFLASGANATLEAAGPDCGGP